MAHMQRRQQPPRPSAPSAGPDRVLDALLEVVHRADGGDLSDDVALLCLPRGRWTGDPEVEDPGRG